MSAILSMPNQNKFQLHFYTVILKLSGEGNGNSGQYSCLENTMDRGDWHANVDRVSKSQT